MKKTFAVLRREPKAKESKLLFSKILHHTKHPLWSISVADASFSHAELRVLCSALPDRCLDKVLEACAARELSVFRIEDSHDQNVSKSCYKAYIEYAEKQEKLRPSRRRWTILHVSKNAAEVGYLERLLRSRAQFRLV